MVLHGVGALAGLATGVMGLCAGRVPAIAWVASAPLGFALALCSPAEAAVAGALAGAMGSAPAVARREFRSLLPITILPTAATGALASAIGSFVTGRLGPAALVVVLPAVTIATFLPLRLMGAPRWVSNPLACTQERWLAVVHTARLGSDYVTTAVLALSGSIVAMGSVAWVTGRVSVDIVRSAIVAAVLVAAAIAFGVRSLRTAIARRGDTVRVAAVVADGPPPPDGALGGLWPVQSADYRDVDGTVRRYDPLVERAAAAGAELIVLPEVAVNVGDITRATWIESVTNWARSHGVVVVAPCFDRDAPSNSLTVVDARGVAGTYHKQHPARGLEPPRPERTPPGPRFVATRRGPVPLSTVLCVDLDYGDLVEPVSTAGGILAAPSNDWFGGFERMHHRTAVWSAVLTGVSTIRATGHGVSAVYDGAGRVLAEQSSADGVVVLVVDAPLAAPRPRRARA